jgi:hypothetical protein
MSGRRKGKVSVGVKSNPLQGQAGSKSQSMQQELLCFNFKYLDANQGQSLEDWGKKDLLLPMLERIHGLSSQTLGAVVGNKSSNFSIYDAFPSKTDFTHPKHVPEDASWARFHVKGKQVVAGHIYGPVFYVVFLDAEHKFYRTELKNT